MAHTLEHVSEKVCTCVFGFALAIIASAIWLFGYARSVAPFAWDYLRDGEFDFLTFSGIKIYRLVDERTGTVSRHLDFFSVADGPTGIEYTEQYFPCWPVSLVAVATLLAGGLYLLVGNDRRSEQIKSP